MTPNRPLVSVVTLTRNRPAGLLRAIASVAAQTGVRAQHIVLGDACDALADTAWSSRLARRYPAVQVHNVHADHHPDMPTDYLPAKLAYLRNLGTVLAAGDLIAQLDDDNVFQPEHLVTLIQALEGTPGAEAAHSWRRVLLPDGSPFVFGDDDEDPWHPVPEERATSFRRLRALGVFEPGTCVVRDALRIDGRVLARVDTSEYLARRTLLRRLPFPERYSSARQRLGYTEDLAFSHELVKHRVVVACNRRPTLDYYLGGYSNRDAVADLVRRTRR